MIRNYYQRYCFILFLHHFSLTYCLRTTKSCNALIFFWLVVSAYSAAETLIRSLTLYLAYTIVFTLREMPLLFAFVHLLFLL